MPFKGFSSGKSPLTPLPGEFFSELLPQIEHLGELKLILYCFWRLDRMTGNMRYLRLAEIEQDELFMAALSAGAAEDSASARAALIEAVQLAVQDGALLPAEVTGASEGETLYFMNTPKGRAAVQAIRRGEWRPAAAEMPAVELTPTPRNIFRLYEELIGPLSPLVAEALGEAEDTYSPAWIDEAFQIAVKRNKRHWRYIEAILKRWKEEGRNDQEDRRDPEKARRKYLEGEYSDFIKH